MMRTLVPSRIPPPPDAPARAASVRFACAPGRTRRRRRSGFAGATLFVLLALLSGFAAAPASAALRVLACEPEWGALARELGGELLDVSVATTAQQDPHRIEARPGLIARARNAGLVVCTGAELEIGWLPILLERSGNARIQPGRPGHFMAAEQVRLLDVGRSADRAHGDVHAAGDPHIQLDPRNIALVADALGARLASVDPANADAYAKRLADFRERWRVATARWHEQVAPLADVPIVSQHRAFTYLIRWLGLVEVAVLEPKPGVEPTAAHLQQVITSLKARPARMVLFAAYQDPRPSEWLAANAGVAAVKLAFTVGGNDAAKDLFGLFDDTVARLLAGAQKKP